MVKYDTAFRTVEQWKSALITLPDTRFFDIMRGVLGNIQSPFNKQRLSDELAAFLSNKDVQKTIAAYIDEADHRIIAAVAALDGPDRRRLASFFSDEYSHAALDTLVVNLEERLILYTADGTSGDGGGRLFLNPLLKNILLPFAEDNDVLFPCVTAAQGQRPQAVFDDVSLAALITFLSGEKNIFKADGTPRKTLFQKIERIFPYGGQTGGMEFFVTALGRLGLVPGGSPGRAEQRLKDFARLTDAERFVYCVAGGYAGMSGEPPETLISRDFIRHIAKSAAALLDAVDENKCYTASALRRLAEVIEAAEVSEITEVARFGRTSPFRTASGGRQLNPVLLVEALEKTGVLLRQNGYYRKREFSRRGNVSGIGDGGIPVIVFDTFFSFTLLPEITFADVTVLSAFCEVAGAKTSVRFKITRSSAARGFNLGIGGRAMFETLKKLSGGNVKNGLEHLLDDWEKTHSEIIIMEGISIVLSEERRYLAQSAPLAPHIVFNPAPGVYMLDFDERDEVKAALKKAGADLVSEPCPEVKKPFQKKAEPFFVSLAATALSEGPPKRAASQALPERRVECGQLSAAEYKKRFRDLLDGLNFPQAERGELNARIERKLVVSPRQLNGAFLRYEKREARGLDYAGKLALVKQALLSNETLEIVFQDSDGSEKCVTLAPVMLGKEADDTFLSAMPPDGAGASGNMTDQACIKIAMGKIRVVRRIKRSIFSN
jgi:hypothetical protein